jgi:hypothetical protein
LQAKKKKKENGLKIECPAGTGGTNNNKGQTKLKTYATLGTIAMIKGMMDSNIN